MRVRTEAKRQAILAAAGAVFAEKGYHDATIADIAGRLRCSKATIYGYFESKDHLLQAVLREGFSPVIAYWLSVLRGPGRFAERLASFARTYVAAMANDYAVSTGRLLAAEVGRSEGMAKIAADPELNPWPRIEGEIAAALAAGDLQGGSAADITRQFRALLCGDLPYRRVMGIVGAVDEAETSASARMATELILSRYGA